MKKGILFTVLIISIGITLTGVEFNLGTGINTYFSDNIFFNATSIKDFVTNLSADINLSMKTFNFYLEGDSTFFADNSDFNSFRVEPGIEFLKYLKGRNYIYFNLSFPILEYKDYYTDFNYSGPAGSIGFKYYVAPTLLFKSGYDFELRNYLNFSSFDFVNHTIFFEINKFFSSQTTVRLQTSFNYRYYNHIDKILPEEDWIIDSNNSAVNSLSIPNVSGVLRVSQGIGAKVGVFGEVELRKNFRGLEDAETLINNSYVIYPYNDNYLWDGNRFTLSIKFIPFAEISVMARVSIFNKNYPGIYVMDEEGIVVEPNEERDDDTFQINFSLSKKFRKFNVYLNFMLRSNKSNDLFFEYDMLTLATGFRYYF